jgi:hypothetical protein
MFNLAIDSKLRGCDLVAIRVEDVAASDPGRADMLCPTLNRRFGPTPELAICRISAAGQSHCFRLRLMRCCGTLAEV